jgi:HSP20 family protein
MNTQPTLKGEDHKMASNIVRYDPFEELTRLQRDMTRLFDESFRAPARSGSDGNGQGITTRAWAPLVDVREDANEVVVHAELPGVKQEDIDIEVTGDTLILRGERKFEETEQKKNYVRVERAYGSFQRSFTIGVPIETDKVAAEFKDGVLTIHLPKSEAIKPKKVQVGGGNGAK